MVVVENMKPNPKCIASITVKVSKRKPLIRAKLAKHLYQ